MDLSHLISIVGAGPGDPELLTVKAQKRLKEADVVLYDALMGGEVLELAKTGAVKKYVGKWNKDGQNQVKRQAEIHREFLYWAGKNKKVVRLKVGDPMIFGRGAEEIRFCKQHGLNYEIIPGITAGIAGASLCSVPLTERGKNSQVLFYTGQKNENGFPGLDSVLKVLDSGSPVIIYMGLNCLAELSRELTANGTDPATTVQVLSRISQSGQQIFTTTLRDTESFLNTHQPETPSTVIIGKNTNQI